MRRPATCVRLAGAIVLAVVSAACAHRPDNEMQQARAALDEARAVGAERFAPTQYAAAATAFRRSEQAAVRRDYRQALRMALDCGERARDAARIAVEQKETARADAIRRLSELEAAVDEVRHRVAAAEAPGGTHTRAQRLALSETRRAIVVANVSLQKARTALVAGDFAAAREATSGVAARLKAVSETKTASSPPPPASPRR